jgi:catechol 2,3-dioxygenase-like lactoylglutathione lyase family enzyme
MADSDLRLQKIGLVMLGVQDLARAVAFYRDQLGLPLQQEFAGEFAFFNAGGVTLALSVPLAKNSPQMVGATELVFSVDGVREAYEALRARGVAFLREPRVVNPPMWAANFTDPDGHRHSIFGPERRA